VSLLTGLMGVATIGALGVFTRPGAPSSQGSRDVWWVAGLVVVFAATEGFVVHVRVRRGGHAVSLSEIPMVLGLLSLDPVPLVLARLVGGSFGLLVLRRQRGTKLAFNVALTGVQVSVAAAVFRLAGGGTTELGINEWLATYAATLSADVVAVVLVTAAIALHDDPGEWRRLPAAMRSVPFIAVSTTVALVSDQAVRNSQWALLVLGALSVVLYLTFRAYVRHDHGRTEVEQLYAFTRALDGAAEMAELIPVVLDRTRDQLRAAVAELVVPDGDAVIRYRIAGQGAMSSMRDTLRDSDEWVRPALLGRPVVRAEGSSGNGMAVPVPVADVTGALLVAESLPDSEDFTESRLHLLEALANHAGMALAKAILVDRLRREAAEKEYLALHDSLSGLPNRRQFQQLLDNRLRDAGERDAVAILVLDLDRFKEINDALGHDTGDALLIEVAALLRDHVAGRGVAARFGGDEFAVLLPIDGTLAGAVAAGERLAALLEQNVRIGPLTLDMRASIGVAVAPLHGRDARTLVRHADVAMYGAKQGRTGLRVYDPSADQNTPQRLARIADLRDAIDRRDLLVVFQPKIRPVTGEVIGAEALARWHHPADGSVPPDEFIPLAEHSGLIRPLTLHVLEMSLRRRAAWARDGHNLHVAVNLSPNSLLDSSLPEVVERLLAQTGTPAAALTLEITESTILADPEGSGTTLERLHRLGVNLSIDDFGTGYSSLGRLRRLPIHEVKIDRSFVRRLAVDHRDRAVVRSAIQLGHALGLEVVAEGVEDAQAYAFLAQESCDVVQGYHLSRPLAPDDFATWLAVRGTAAELASRPFAG
jgi:diguanylate cyclase (GGDEF)-like protein